MLLLLLYLPRRSLKDTAPPNSTPRRFPSYLLLCFLFIFYLPRYSLPDFHSISSLASMPFLSCCHQTTTFGAIYRLDIGIRSVYIICIYILLAVYAYMYIMCRDCISVFLCSNRLYQC